MAVRREEVPPVCTPLSLSRSVPPSVSTFGTPRCADGRAMGYDVSVVHSDEAQLQLSIGAAANLRLRSEHGQATLRNPTWGGLSGAPLMTREQVHGQHLLVGMILRTSGRGQVAEGGGMEGVPIAYILDACGNAIGNVNAGAEAQQRFRSARCRARRPACTQERARLIKLRSAPPRRPPVVCGSTESRFA